MNKDCPLLFADAEYHKGVDLEHMCLSYTVEPISLTQTRFRNRLIAKPRINFSEYEIKAVFDWIEISIKTKELHQAGNIHRRLMKLNEVHQAFTSCYVTGPTRQRHYLGDRFVVRIQEPLPKGLRLLLRAILDHYCSEGTEFDEIPLVGLELSLDIYPARAMHFEQEAYVTRRMLMTEVLHKHIVVHDAQRKSQRRPRFTYSHPSGTGSETEMLIKASKLHVRGKLTPEEYTSDISIEELASLVPELHKQPYLDGTLYFGKKNERLFYKCMDKTDDIRIGAEASALPFEKTRSRIELTLIDEVPGDRQGPYAVDLKSIDHIGTHGLTEFNKLLQFALPTFTKAETCEAETNAEEWRVFSKSGVAGLMLMHDVRDKLDVVISGKSMASRRELLSTGRCTRYSDLNRRVTKAFSALGRRWAKVW